jgi:hypothetical protein
MILVIAAAKSMQDVLHQGDVHILKFQCCSLRHFVDQVSLTNHVEGVVCNIDVL